MVINYPSQLLSGDDGEDTKAKVGEEPQCFNVTGTTKEGFQHRISSPLFRIFTQRIVGPILISCGCFMVTIDADGFLS